MDNSKEGILAAIRRNKPTTGPLPTVPSFEVPAGDLAVLFTEAVEQVKGTVFTNPKPEALAEHLHQLHPDAQRIWSDDEDLLRGNVDIDQDTPPASLADLEIALVRGTLGVAENGAIWVPESSLPQRVIAFITQHLVIVLDRQRIVGNMHQAYQALGTDLPGFGLFISGPSKTADIEQSLVVGAHGPRSLTVCLE